MFQGELSAGTPVFGRQEAGRLYTLRRAAYVVVVNERGEVALVEGARKHFLPGGGSLPGETPEETILREVLEELARGVRLTRRLGEATQYFYSESDGCHYRMLAVFFAGEFTGEETDGPCEHELRWLPIEEAERACFHACHSWAARMA